MTQHASIGPVSAHQLPDGFDGPRACGKYELGGVLDLGNLVMRLLNTPQGMPPRWPTIGFDWAHVYNHENLDNIRLVSCNGRIVSSVAIYPSIVRTPRGDVSVGGINCFVTHPDYRRHGLGAAVLKDAHEKMRANGHHIALLGTGIQDYYRKFGWESAGRQRNFVFDRGNIAILPDPAGLDITEDWRPYAAELSEMHNRESLVAPRSAELFTLLAERKFQRLFVARRGGRPIAYAGVSGTSVREYGGALEDVAALLRAVFTEIDDPSVPTSESSPARRATIEMTVTTPDAMEGLPGYLLSQGFPNTLEYIGMILILDPPGLFQALGISVVQLEPRDSGWRLRYGGQTLDLSECELVKLVFGPERYPDFASEVFPVDFFQWSLDRV